MKRKNSIPAPTIERLIIYRRELKNLQSDKSSHLYSHHLAELSNSNSPQVRRDLMIAGCAGTLKNGYNIQKLIKDIDNILEDNNGLKIALVGVGNLGKAVLSNEIYRDSKSLIVAAFDVDKEIIGNSFSNCSCYHIDDLKDKIFELGIDIGIITTPRQHAQQIADLMVYAGIRGILNFAPISLRVPDNVYLDRIDISMSLDKVNYFTNQHQLSAIQ
ncbi:MAG TPA: redox-sensing transcriptional repressor Rex [Victivallales bacterium]|nr:redox-sensing transcriptional repressor Rex [Victivallales bacterium]